MPTASGGDGGVWRDGCQSCQSGIVTACPAITAFRAWVSELFRTAAASSRARTCTRTFPPAHSCVRTHVCMYEWQLPIPNNRPVPFSNADVSIVTSLILCGSFFPESWLCFPSGLCFWVSPTTLILLIYTWTSAVVRYASSDPGASALFFPGLLLMAIPSSTPPLTLPSTAEVDGGRRDTGAVSSSLVRGDLRRLW